MKICKLLLAAAGATALLGALVSSASARNLSTSNQLIRMAWSTVTLTAAGGNCRCQLTLEGSMHARTTSKSIGSLIGYITSAILGPCPAGTGTILRETLPWHVTYSGFQGTLPEINSFITHAVGVSFRIRDTGGTICLARSTAAKPGIGTTHRNTTTKELTEVGLGGRIPTGAECFGAELTLESTSGAISVLGTSSTRLTISLI